MRTIVECVPNFSEGRDRNIVGSIVEAIAGTPGAAVLGQTWDYDHNRSVVTFAGEPEAVVNAAYRGIESAVRWIDLNRHDGVHPRIGAADVVPLVPISGVTLEDCVRLAERLGQQVWNRLHVPVYLYEAAARRPDRANLANIRRGGFRKLLEEVRVNIDRRPDIGEPVLHPTAGACVIGARKLLIAFNVHLATTDVEIARRIAKKIRFSAGGLPCVKALGLFLRSRNQAQVSINVTDFEKTSLATVFAAVLAETERLGVKVEGSEIVGLVPRKALSEGVDLKLLNFSEDLVLENQLAKAGLLGGPGA
ncbi:MAG TPA: glutamate formimidoyltransferase [Bryobacteraceae bacterium]|nr:glutamate formimidoyltransferase [Bryobacteraceae bacterium]